MHFISTHNAAVEEHALYSVDWVENQSFCLLNIKNAASLIWNRLWWEGYGKDVKHVTHMDLTWPCVLMIIQSLPSILHSYVLLLWEMDGPVATVSFFLNLSQTLMGKVSMTVGRLKAGSRTSSRKNSGSSGLKKSDSSASNRSKGKHSKSASISVLSLLFTPLSLLFTLLWGVILQTFDLVLSFKRTVSLFL